MPKSDHTIVEQEHHRRAFQEFYALGPKRTYQQAADKMGLSASTIKLWCRTLGWRQRIQDRDAEAARRVPERSAQTMPEDLERDLKIVRMAKMKLAKDIAEGKVKGRLSDLEMIIRLEAELLAGVGDRLAWIERESDPEKLRTRLREIAAGAELPPEGPPPTEATGE